MKNKQKQENEAKIINDMTISIVEDIVNEVMTRETPKTKFTLTHHDLDQMIGDIAESDIAESLEAVADLEEDSCNICGKILECMETIEEHKRNLHVVNGDPLIKNVTCNSCENHERKNSYKDAIIMRKNECITQLGKRIRKMSVEKRTLVIKLKSLKSEKHIKEVSNGVEEASKEGNKYNCKQCNFSTNVISLIGRHIIQKHSNKKECKHCNKTFSFKDSLRRHIKHRHRITIIDTDANDVVTKTNCVECKNKDEVIKHKEAELDKKENHIKKVTPKSNELKKAKEEIELARNTIADNVKTMNLLIIERDTLKATNALSNKVASTQDEQEDEIIEIQEPSEHKCRKCNYCTKNLEDLRKHMEEIHKIGVSCPTCDKRFVFISDMKKHKRTVHDNATYSCNVCGTLFQTKKGWNDHRQKRCRTSVQREKQTTEVIVAELLCHHCQYKTADQGQFINHMSSHTHKLVCKICSLEFVEKSSLINHQVTKHCTCSYCKSTFQTFEESRDHICNMHPFRTVHEQKRRQKRMNTECFSGQNCEHKRKGRCWFKHRLVVNNSQQDGHENQSRQQNNERVASWCKFQDRCDRRGTCTFRHYDNVGYGRQQGGQGGHAGQGGRGGQGGQGGLAGHEDLGGQGGLAEQGSLAGQEGNAEQGGRTGQGNLEGQSPVQWIPRLHCQQCGYQTNSQNELVYHMETRHQQANIKCDNCPNTFISSETLVSHIVETHTRCQRQSMGFPNTSFQENF